MNLEKLEECLAELIGRARRAADMARTMCLEGETPANSRSVWSSVSALETAPMLAPATHVAVETLQRAVGSALEKYFLRTEKRFEGYSDPEEGDVGEIVEVSIYSEKARPLIRRRGELEYLAEGRDRVDDVLKAWGEPEAALNPMR